MDEETIYNYSFNNALKNNNDNIINLCLNKNVTFDIDNENFIAYVENILINNNMMNIGNSVDILHHKIEDTHWSFTSKYNITASSRWSFQKAINKLFEPDEYLINDQTNKID